MLDACRAAAAARGVPFDGRFGRVAAEAGCDRIVMATHGRGAFGELLFGSHTRNMLSRSRLPLLVLH